MQYPQSTISSAHSELLKLLPPGSTVYTILRHKSRSGLTRYIEPLCIINNEPQQLTHYFHVLLGRTSETTYEGVRVNGCGMDMGAALVYRISFLLYNAPKALKQRWI